MNADRSVLVGVQELLPRRRRQRFALVVLARRASPLSALNGDKVSYGMRILQSRPKALACGASAHSINPPSHKLIWTSLLLRRLIGIPQARTVRFL